MTTPCSLLTYVDLLVLLCFVVSVIIDGGLGI